MRIVINLLLIAVAAFLLWTLFTSIKEPIAFKDEKDRRENAVIEKLKQIRTAQELFRNIKGGFAPNFDTLSKVLSTERFAIIGVNGDPDDPNFTGTITYDTSYSAAIDSINRLGINLDSLRFVPFSNGVAFDLKADTLTYQKTLVQVIEVGTKRVNFMGPYADKRFARYDQNYDPEKPIKFGNLGAPNLSGNWER